MLLVISHQQASSQSKPTPTKKKMPPAKGIPEKDDD